MHGTPCDLDKTVHCSFSTSSYIWTKSLCGDWHPSYLLLVEGERRQTLIWMARQTIASKFKEVENNNPNYIKMHIDKQMQMSQKCKAKPTRYLEIVNSRDDCSKMECAWFLVCKHSMNWWLGNSKVIISSFGSLKFDLIPQSEQKLHFPYTKMSFIYFKSVEFNHAKFEKKIS